MGLTIALALLFLLILVVGHEFGHFVAAKFLGAPVEEFGVGFPPRIFAKRFGETEYSVNAIPFGGFVRIHGENESGSDSEPLGTEQHGFAGLPIWRKLTIVAAGVFMNVLMAWAAFSVVFMIGVPSAVIVSRVSPESPAAVAGVTPGDQLIGFDKPIKFTNFVSANAGNEIVLKISRNGETKEIKIVPRVKPPEGEGRLGVAIVEGGAPKENFFKAIVDGAKLTWESTRSIFLALSGLVKGIFIGEWGRLSEVTGPVGVFGIVGEAAKAGPVYLLELFGLISINLAVVNSFPFPALDGGRIAILLIRKIIRRPISVRVEGLINAVGLIFLLFLMLVVTIRDISRIL